MSCSVGCFESGVAAAADLQLYPTSANAIVVVYNLNGVTDLVLTMQPREAMERVTGVSTPHPSMI